jgi:hypothetical protein
VSIVASGGEVVNTPRKVKSKNKREKTQRKK